MSLNTSGRCDHCGGTVRNGAGKRLSIPALTERHNESCPGLNRRRTPK